jgi:hypothetical protein
VKTLEEVISHFADRCDALNRRCSTLLECLQIERELRAALQVRVNRLEEGTAPPSDFRDPVAEETNEAKIYILMGDATNGR